MPNLDHPELTEDREAFEKAIIYLANLTDHDTLNPLKDSTYEHSQPAPLSR